MLNTAEQLEVTELCRALVRSRSLSGEEQEVATLVRNYMEQKGFSDIHIDRYGSISGCIKGLHPGPKILYDGHIDTVPVPDKSLWKHDPFGGEVLNGRIYGRGTSDMKGALAAMLVGAASFARKTKQNFAGSVYVAGVVHEECFEGIAAREVSAHIQPDVVIIGEASELNVKIGQRGRAELVFETFGIPAHSANPQNGVNAVHAMLRLVAEVEKIQPESHPVLGSGVAVLTDIISTPYPGASVVPSHCRATYDRRLLVGEKPESVIKPYQAAIDRLTAADPTFKGKVSYATGTEKCWTGETISGERFFPGWIFDEKEDFVQRALQGLRVIGQQPAISHYSFCTNASHYAGEKGIKTLGYGPSSEKLAHVIDEYIEESHLHTVTAGYAAISDALLQK